MNFGNFARCLIVCTTISLSSAAAQAQPDCSPLSLLKDAKFSTAPELTRYFVLSMLSKDDFDHIDDPIKPTLRIPYFQTPLPAAFEELSRQLSQLQGLTETVFDDDDTKTTMLAIACTQLGHKLTTNKRIRFEVVHSDPYSDEFYLQISYPHNPNYPAQVPISINAFWAEPPVSPAVWPKVLESGKNEIIFVKRKHGGPLLIEVAIEGGPTERFQQPWMPRKLTTRMLEWSFSYRFTRTKGTPISGDEKVPVCFPNANGVFVTDSIGSNSGVKLNLNEEIIPSTLSVRAIPVSHLPTSGGPSPSHDQNSACATFTGHIDNDDQTQVVGTWSLTMKAVTFTPRN